MVGTLLQAIVAFILTGVIGSRIAHSWQARAAKEARFFEASKDMYTQMMSAAEGIASLIGKRLYAMQRVCLLSPTSSDYNNAVSSYHAAIIEWNERLLSLELAVRTRFKNASLSEFERIQGRLAHVTRLVERLIASNDRDQRSSVMEELRRVRAEFFYFTQSMTKEAQLLHRQMHFGVVVKYDRWEIEQMSTQNLVKALFTSRIEGQAVVRSPSDFGLPVSVGDARFGIYE